MPRSRINLPKISLLIIFISSLLLTGCSSLPVHSPLPQGLTFYEVDGINPEAPYAWHPDGNKIAYVKGELRIRNIATGEITKIDAAPSAISWSPDGSLLAAAFVQEKNSTLRILALNGAVIDESVVSGHVTRVAWRSNDEILAPSLTLERFKFGSNLRVILHRWKRGTAPVATSLNDVTIMPSRSRKLDKIYFDSFSFALSPFADEIAYTRVVDPPNFPSYMKIIIRHLESGVEKEAPGIKLDNAGAVYSFDAEHIIYGDGVGITKHVDPWTGDEREVIATPGRNIAVSPGDSYLFTDGRLYLNEREIAAFHPACEGAFAPVGGKLLLKCDDSLSLLSGLIDGPNTSMMPEQMERILSLRKWRSEGLISNQEYQTAKQKELKQ